MYLLLCEQSLKTLWTNDRARTRVPLRASNVQKTRESMKIFGLDFTSAPRSKKPITCAVCELQDNLLQVKDCLKINSLPEFETFLRLSGPWLAALDFPFGQPAKLLANLGDRKSVV